MVELDKIYFESALVGLRKMPPKSVDCCVTSPPYFGLRNYGSTEQIGIESTPELYVSKLIEVFSEVKRVLKNTGTLWLNLGDSYSGSGKGFGDTTTNWKQSTNKGSRSGKIKPTKIAGLKAKDLIGIPWMVAFALRTNGWYLRQDIIWNKPNPMPESVTDRCTKAHEYIFLMSKSQQYYYDGVAIKTKVADATVQRMLQQIEDQKGSTRAVGKTNGTMKAVGPGRKVRKGVDIKGGNQGRESGIPAMALNGNGVLNHSGYFDSLGNVIGGGGMQTKSQYGLLQPSHLKKHILQRSLKT